MKTKKHFEGEADRLRMLLPAPTKAQVRWMEETDLKASVKEYDERKKKVSSYNYYGVVTTFRGWQIVRYFLVHSDCSRRGYTLHYLTEVSQRWFRLNEDKGTTLVVFEKQYAPFWYNNNQPYCLDSPLNWKPAVGGSLRKCLTAFNMAREEVYPHRRFSNDFKDSDLVRFIGMYDEINLYDDVLADIVKQHGDGRKHYLPTIVETLFEMGEERLAEFMLWKDGWEQKDFKKYWDSFLIARRSGLRRTYKGWMDWLDYVKDLDKLGRDIRSPKYVAPLEGITSAHDRVIRLLERKRKKQEKEDEVAKWSGKYKERTEKYFGLVIKTKSGITITPLKSVQDFWDEAEAMHHCVWTCGYYAKEDSLVLSARSADGKRVETIDVDLHTMKVSQSRGVCNKPTDFHKEIVKAMTSNMWRVKRIYNRSIALAA